MVLNLDVVYSNEISQNAGMIADASIRRLHETNRRRHIRRLIFYFLVGVVLTFIFAVACVAMFFRAKEIQVVGCGIYDEYLIAECCGITQDQNLYTIDEKEVERAIVSRYPYVNSVKVELDFPTTVRLVVREEIPSYFFELCGQYYILSDSLRVLEITEDLASITVPSDNLISIKTVDVAFAVEGSRITFEDENYYEYAQKMLYTFEHCAVADHITLIDFSDKYDIFFVYDHRFRIEIGTADDIADKVTMAIKIMDTFSERDTGVINVSLDPAYAELDAMRTER